jgi:membrane protease YdiL (CAAX protease family)
MSAGDWRNAGVSRPLSRVLSYYAAVFVITHAFAGVYLLRGGSWSRPGSFIVANLAMLIPGLVAAAAARWLFREPVRRALGLRWVLDRWLAIGWLLPLILSFAVLVVGIALPRASYSADLVGLSERFHLNNEQLHQMVLPLGQLPLVWSLVAQALLLGPTLCALTGLGEEAGWRGLLFYALGEWGFWRRSWIIGLLWGIWHVPLVFEGYGYPNHRVLGALMLLVFTLLASPLYVFLRMRSGSVLAPAVCHGSFGASMLLTFAPVAGGTELTSGLIALPGILVMLAVNLGLFLIVRRDRPRRSTPSPIPRSIER